MIDRYGFISFVTIIFPPTAPTKQTTEPTDRSIFPPVRIQNNIPVARINTYAFCTIRLLTFWGRSIFPPVFTVNRMITSANTITIVYFFNTSENLILFSMAYSPLLDFRIRDMMFSWVASCPLTSPTIFPSFMI